MAGSPVGVAKWSVAAILLLGAAAGAMGETPLAPVASAFIHPLDVSGSLPVEVTLGAATTGRYTILLQADGQVLEERRVTLTGRPRTVVLYAPEEAREVQANGVAALPASGGLAAETPEEPAWTPPAWLALLAGAPLVLLLRPRLRRLRERWWMEIRYPTEFEAQRSLQRFDRTWRERYSQLSCISRNLQLRGIGRAPAI